MAAPLDPRDPRNRDDDPPQRPEHLSPQRPADNYPQRDRQQQPDQREQYQPEERNHARSLPAADPAHYGPVAPEPVWETPPRSFDRERFLLQCFAVALIAQYAILTAGIYICNSAGIRRLEKGIPPPTPEQNRNCLELSTKLDNTFELSLSTILALLGGASLAASAARRSGPPDRR